MTDISCTYCESPATHHVCDAHASSQSLKEASVVILDQAQQIAKLNTELSAFRNPPNAPF